MVDELAETREGGAVSTTFLLDAGEAEISARGFARTKVEHVAERAGVSTDVFHAHFPGMGALLRALDVRFVEQMAHAVEAATASGSWQGSRVRDVVEIAVRSILDVVHDRQGLVRAVGFSLLLGVSLAHHTILVGDDWSGVRFTKEEVAEETARVISAYLVNRTPS